MEFNTEIFSQFNKKWALVCAGTPEDHNAMTISWGGMGTLWGRPVVTVYVKPIRHTFNYLNANEYFTVSFFPEECRDALNIMGTLSGRNTDKDAASGLTAVAFGQGTSYAQAQTTLLCRKLYAQDLDAAAMPPEVVKAIYSKEAPHRMFIGEVVAMG